MCATPFQKVKDDPFGENHPRNMPVYFFWDAVDFDESSAQRADISRQNYVIGPRFWYVDVTILCRTCRQQFIWTAKEQKFWFEDLHFWVGSHRTLCDTCKRVKRLRKEYDSEVAAARDHGSAAQKARIIEIVADLRQSGGKLHGRMLETAALFEQQLARKEPS